MNNILLISTCHREKLKIYGKGVRNKLYYDNFEEKGCTQREGIIPQDVSKNAFIINLLYNFNLSIYR